MVSDAGPSAGARTHEYDNGLVLVAESMPWLESVAFSLLLPAGCAFDPLGQYGLANLASEMVQRGCGRRTNREFVEELENLGVDRTSSVSNAHSSFGGAMPADRLYAALEIFADLVQRPLLPEAEFEDGRQVCLQEVRALEDDLAQRVFIELRESFYAEPFGRSGPGSAADLSRLTLEDVRTFVQRNYRPNGAILSVAGRLDWPRLRDHVGSLFGGWASGGESSCNEQPPSRGYRHLTFDSSQTHIGVAYESVPYADADYYQARGAVGILSDGMSSRLFTEVRERRGLCYAVYAMCHSLRDRGGVLCYAGTTTERAQETLDVMLAELQRLQHGVEAEELQRLKARIKSALIMQQESSASRSSSMAADWYHLGRIPTLEEVGRIVDELTCESINGYLAQHPPGEFTVVTLGEESLEIPVGIP